MTNAWGGSFGVAWGASWGASAVPVVTTIDYGGIPPLTEKERKRQKLELRRLEQRRGAEWAKANAEAQALRAELREALSPSAPEQPPPPVFVPQITPRVVIPMPKRVQPKPVAMRPVILPIPDDTDEHDIELLLLAS